jgi:DNA polymerase
MESEKLKRLEALYLRVRTDPDYRNENMGQVFVPGAGSMQSGVVFIGEAPGREEEREETPFVGPAGQNLNALLALIGLARDAVFITNLVKYRPVTPRGENRAPNARESRRALPYLFEELELLCPAMVVCLGLSPAKALLQNPGLRMGEANGTTLELRGYKVFTTYHPSPFNYRVPAKREATEDSFLRLGEWLNERRRGR